MDFYPITPLDTNVGHNKVWGTVREAFAEEEGLAFYRFPIYLPGGYLHREIDILLLLRDHGVFVIECKGYRIGNIQSIRGHVWELRDWYQQQDTPFEQVLKQMYALRKWLEPLGDLEQKVRFFHRVALPLVSRTEWEQSGLDILPSTQAISTNDELTVDALRRWVFGAPLRQDISPEEWKKVLAQLVAPDVACAYTPRNVSDTNRQRIQNHGVGILGTSITSPSECSPANLIHPQREETMTSQQLPMTLLFYEGDPPSAEYIRGEIPELQENSGYMYVVATKSQERRRTKEGFTPSLQKGLDEEGSEESQLLFHRALRHWLKTPILRRFEEWILLRHAMHDVITDERRRNQLYHDVFAWQRALKRIDEEGIRLEEPLSIDFAERLVHPELGAILCDLKQGYLNQVQAQQPPRLHFEAEARSFLESNFRPSKIVVMEGFSRLTPLQQLFLDRCLIFNAQVFVLCPYQEKQHYGFEAVHCLYKPFKERGSLSKKIPTTNSTPQGSLLRLQEHIFSEQETEQVPCDSSVTLEAYTHRHNEAKACVKRILDYLKEGCHSKEIVVVAHDLAGYQPLLLEEAYLQNTPELFNIPPRLLLLTPVGRFALSLYNVWQEDSLHLDAEQFESFLASGLLGLEAQESTDVFRLVKAQVFARSQTEDEWNNALAQLRKLRESLQPFQRFSPKLVEERTVTLWQAVLCELRSICQRLFVSRGGSIREHIQKLLDELERLSDRVLRESERGVLQGIKDALEELSESHSIPLSTQEFGEILNGMVQERTDEEEKLRQDRIAVVSPDSLDGHRVQKVFYLGLDNQHVPRPFVESWPFETLNIDDHLRQERYLFLAAIRAASDSLHASFPLTHERQSFRPSIYLEEAARWLALGRDLNRPVDAFPPEGVVAVDEKPIEIGPVGQALRRSYDLAEIAHFALCPYRYKLERIDKQAQCYSLPWQVTFAAESFWLSSIFSYLIENGCRAPSGRQALHHWLDRAFQETEAVVRRSFPGLRSLDWVGVRQYVEGTLEYFERVDLEYGKYVVEVCNVELKEVELMERGRPTRIRCEIRYGVKRGHYMRPYTQDTFVEQWLRYGPKPPDEEQEETSFADEDTTEPQEDKPSRDSLTRTIQGIQVFVHQYDAARWWRKAVHDVFYFQHAAPTSTPAFLKRSRQDYEVLCKELSERIQQMGKGIYPKKPGRTLQILSLARQLSWNGALRKKRSQRRFPCHMQQKVQPDDAVVFS